MKCNEKRRSALIEIHATALRLETLSASIGARTLAHLFDMAAMEADGLLLNGAVWQFPNPRPLLPPHADNLAAARLQSQDMNESDRHGVR